MPDDPTGGGWPSAINFTTPTSLIFSEDPDTVSIEDIRASNLLARDLTDLVTVFVGGTGGVAESTLKELFLRATTPKAYIIGRDHDKGNSLAQELMEKNPGSEAIFLKADISLMRTVDEVCEELKRRESVINVLFLSAGFMSIKGRDETSEGLDLKMAVNYYSRMRFTQNLMPQLTAASNNKQISRVVSVLAAGSEANMRMDDMDLQKEYTLHLCLTHCVMMTDFMFEEFAKKHPGTAFSHSYPGTIKSGITDHLSGPIKLAIKVLYSIMSPWIMDFRESGERHFFQITSSKYPARNGSAGIPLQGKLRVSTGSDGAEASGAYLLDWDGKPAGDEEIIVAHREQNAGQKIWDHTMQMLRDAVTNKRKADAAGMRTRNEEHARTAPNLAGWRAG